MRALTIGTVAVGVVVVLGSRAFAAGFDPPTPEPPMGAVVSAVPAVHPSLGDRVGASDELDDALTAMIQRNCAVCHNDQMLTGQLSLQRFDVAKAAEQAQAAEKMITKLRANMMPPPGMPRPGGDTLTMLVQRLEEHVDGAAANARRAGTRRFQRLNQDEYRRAIRTLLALDVNASNWLPSDNYVSSYDTYSDAQGLSTTLLEAYLRGAADISRLAVGNPGAAPTDVMYAVPIEVSQHAWDYVEGAPYGTRGGIVVTHDFPVDGEYVLSVATVISQKGKLFEDIDFSIDGEQVAQLALPISRGARVAVAGAAGGGTLQTKPVFVRAGQRRVSATFVRKIEGPYEDRFVTHLWSMVGGEDSSGWSGYGITALPHVTELVVSGPSNPAGVSETASREKIFTCRPASDAQARPCAESIISRIAHEAYRRPLTSEDISGLMEFYDLAAVDGFETGVRTALQAVLSHPSFIFRMEEEPVGLRAGDSYPLNGEALASRLSFFLWGTVPDQDLITLAAQGRLTDSAVLDQQVRRMLADPRSEALATRFASQWLRLQTVDGVVPQSQLYPDYNRQVADAMKRETQLLFDHLVREDRSFLDLFTADYTFVNERLARYYGIPYTGGGDFERVQVTDPRRIGLLGHGSVLTLSSLANRTSPVLRGKWVMEVLLGTPPPPPPPNVPVLDATAATSGGVIRTTRERMEAHRRSPTCNSCHQFIDPIGLALDNFDVGGRWRDRENGRALDTRGRYYDGTEISTPQDLRRVLLSRPIPLVRNFTENMLAYAIGRPLDYMDKAEVRKIAADATEDGYRMSSFVLGVVMSDQFRMKEASATNE